MRATDETTQAQHANLGRVGSDRRLRPVLLPLDSLAGEYSVTHQQQMSERWQLAFNSASCAINATMLFLIAAAIKGLERAYRYFEQKEYAWLVPGGTKGTNAQ